jgi:hypothetical protein
MAVSAIQTSSQHFSRLEAEYSQTLWQIIKFCSAHLLTSHFSAGAESNFTLIDVLPQKITKDFRVFTL